MMNGSPVYQSNSNSHFEMRLLSRGLSFLALLTAVLYLRAILAGGLFAADSTQLTLWSILFVALGMVGLLFVYRWERAGSLMTIGAGIGLFVIFLVARQPLMTIIFYSSPFIITGILDYACWWRDCRRSK